MKKVSNSNISTMLEGKVAGCLLYTSRFDKEKFFPISRDIVNMFKIRASYGELGNENIGEYQYMRCV